MKTIASALVALSVLAGIAAPASAAWNPKDVRAQQEQSSLSTQQVKKVAWSEQDQQDFWTQQEDR